MTTPDTAPLAPIGGEGPGEGKPHLLSRRSLLGAVTLLLASRALASTPSPRALITLFLRGGVDGLAMVPPLRDPVLPSLRGVLTVRGVPLDSGFSLHPALSPLLPLFKSNRLAVLHAVGQTQPSRSHFDAQDFLESGTPGQKQGDGYLNRALRGLDGARPPFQAVALQSALPTSLSGEAPALAFPALKDFKVAGGSAAHTTFEALYDTALDEALRTSGRDAFESTSFVRDQGLATAQPRNGATYPNSPLGKRLKDLARLLHAEVGLRVGVTEAGGFDTHLAQGGDEGQLANRLKDLGAGLAAFAQDLGPRLDDVTVLTVTEFGRTAKENGTRGTDHGTASAMFVLGGGVRGGRVFADWPGLSPSSLFEGRDLAVTTDVRQVLAEAITRALGPGLWGAAFPGFTPKALGLFG
ncbi:MAG: DUF1501 domain-containing protein [Myxococcales bacterium]|nr:DUF1501 domain-containing protein [Myxococcales bacterium]